MNYDTPLWTETAPVELSATSLQHLLSNRIPIVVIPGFASADECADVVKRSDEIGFAPYEDVEPRVDKIGVSVFEHHVRGDRASYFRAAARAREVQRRIFELSFDPVARFIDVLASVTGSAVKVATDRYGEYYAGLIRRIEGGTLLHIDYAPAEQPGWSISSIVEQLSWNLYCELDPARPGVTHIYRRQWQPDDEQFKVDGTYGYRLELVAGVQRATFEPTIGDVYLFNTRNFHLVEASGGRRMTATSACGVRPDRTVELWS